ncbi:MAG: cytochrome c peroxidase [Planctomycetota bacterium]
MSDPVNQQLSSRHRQDKALAVFSIWAWGPCSSGMLTAGVAAVVMALNVALGQLGWATDASRDLSAAGTSEMRRAPRAGATVGRRLDLPELPHEYVDVDWPPHFRSAMARFDNTPPENPLTNTGATLGRVLFYDKTLSRNGTTSCGSCHKQSLAFTDDATVSIGFNGQSVQRNSMSLVNVRFYQRGRFFWDERARSLEEQVLMPIENPIEMGHSLEELVEQLANDPIYPDLFQAAFGSPSIDVDRIRRGLAQFVRSIVSYRSRYDDGLAATGSVLEPFPNFTDEENQGKDIFFRRANCASCHLSNGLPFNPHRDEHYDSSKRPPRQLAFFTMTRPAVNGIDSDVPGVDLGVGGFNLAAMDRGRFKSPSLRNIQVTGPYMHDGRFKTIDAVIEHYNWSVRPHPNLDARLASFAANGMALPEKPKVALARFLETLTDRELLTDPRFSDPFRTDGLVKAR